MMLQIPPLHVLGLGTHPLQMSPEGKHWGVQADQSRTVNHQGVVSMEMSSDIPGCSRQRIPPRDANAIMQRPSVLLSEMKRDSFGHPRSDKINGRWVGARQLKSH